MTGLSRRLRAAAVVASLVAAPALAGPLVTLQPPTGDAEVARYVLDPARSPSPSEAMARLLRAKIRYVFILFNENNSFDHEYGTFPGANGLYSNGRDPRGPEATPGFRQRYLDRYTGRVAVVTPFRLGPEQNATVSDSVDHGHLGLAAKLAVDSTGAARMTGFAQVEYDGKAGPIPPAAASAKGRQYANLVMSHIDCDTIPFFWRYADRFVLFDDIFATEDTPSTPNAIAMIAGQAGETQWVRHGAAGMKAPVSGLVDGVAHGGTATTQGPPLRNDPQPFWGSQFDATIAGRQPVGPRENYANANIASNMTFATVPLTAMGADIRKQLAGDRHPDTNQTDIGNDIAAIEKGATAPIPWRWYENGYDHEPSDPPGVTTHDNYVTHHDGPQYFGYLADNTSETGNLRGEGDLFADVAAHRLPAGGGIIYVRGGYGNIQHLEPPITNPAYPRPLSAEDRATIRATKSGDDDHPAYSDHQIAEAMNARVINAIAADPALWAQSAIIITYDESDGFYDHVPPRILAWGPDGFPLSRGIRVPLLVISPYARAHTVSHAEGDHNAVIETINAIFGLPALSSLPDEAAALKAGNAAAFNRFAPPGFAQTYLGPRDTPSPITDSLLSAFDPDRLRGSAPPLPASYATIPEADVAALPHYGGHGCERIGMVPEDKRQGIVTPPPPGFNPLPGTLPQYDSPAP